MILGIAVGSAAQQVCSIGSFARAEASELRAHGCEVQFLEPLDAFSETFPPPPDIVDLSHIILHIPSLHDRKRPWHVLSTLAKLRWLYPRTKLVLTLHEYTEAPRHWKLRAKMASVLADGIIVNTDADYSAVSNWGRPVSKLSLGPTLWNAALLESPTRELLQRERAIAVSRVPNEIPRDLPWVLHAGLLTPGKGIEFLQEWAHAVSEQPENPSFRFILMGGIGPKERDRKFARSAVSGFRDILGERFTYLEAPDDETYRDLLIASDLVAFPYESGVSERRSTFLAACSTGANVWTTTNTLSEPLRLDESGAYHAPVQSRQQCIKSLSQALAELPLGSEERRLKNLRWAAARGWKPRVDGLLQFLSRV